MNNSTTPRLWVQAVILFVSLVVTQRAYGQCSDFVSYPSGPVTINLTLGAGGSVNLTNAVLNAYGFVKNPACDFWLATAQAGPYNNTPIGFTCADVASSPHTYYVRAGGLPAINNLGGPGATIIPITINVIDNIVPTITAPAGPFTRNANGVCNYVIAGNEFDPTAYNDNCPSPIVEYSIDAGAWVAGTTLNGVTLSGSGAHTIAWRIRDASNNTAYASVINVQVNDTTAPIVACPMDLTVGNDANLCTAIVNSIDVNASDNCGIDMVYWNTTGATVIPLGLFSASGVEFNEGTTTVNYDVYDLSSNLTSCSFMVTVKDLQVPNITCPPNTKFYATDNVACTYKIIGSATDATASDNCTLSSLSNDLTLSNTLDGAVLNAGSIYSITWTATDAAVPANTKSCSMSITVLDTFPPDIVVFFATNYSVNVTPGDCSAAVTIERPNDFIVAFPFIVSNYSVTDCSGTAGPYEGGAFVNGVFDPNFLNSVPALNTLDPTNRYISLQFPVGTTRIPYSWSDIGGNIDTVFITVVVNENEAPVAKCKPGIVNLTLDASGHATLAPALVDNGSSDNCGGVVLSVSPNTFNCMTLGNQSVTLTVDDLSPASPSSTCSATVNVVDNAAPIVNCPTNIQAAAGANCQTGASAITGLGLTAVPTGTALSGPGQYTDNCGVSSLTYNLTGVSSGSGNYPIPNGVVFNKGVTTVTYTFKDASLNSTVCSFTVNVADQTAPTTANCPGNITINTNPGGCLGTASWTVPSWTDNCPGTITVVPAHTQGSTQTQFYFVGVNNVAYTATDAAGNVKVCSFTVTVVDNQAPIAKCKPFTANLNGAGQATIIAANVDNNSTDNCFYSASVTPTTFNCTNLGANIVTLTVTDAGGLTSTCTATVTVADNQAPVALCNFIPTSLSLSAGAPGQVVLNSAASPTGVGNATDNCTNNITYSVSVDGSVFAPTYTFNCNHIGVRTVTLKATDTGGSSTCSVQLTVKDLSAPTFTVPTAKTIDCNSSNPNLLNPNQNPALGVPTNIVDNCDGAPTVTFSDNTSTVLGCPNALNIVRTWTVADHATPPNASSQVQNITVRDITPPVWTMATSFSANTNNANNCSAPSPVPPVTIPGTVSDQCGSVNVSYGITFPNPNFGFVNVPAGTPLPLNGIVSATFPVGVSTVTYVAVDECGNKSTQTVTVTINDTQAPVFTYNKCGQTYTLPNTTNACSQLYSWTRPVAGDLFDCKGITVTESFSDNTVTNFINLVTPFNWPPSQPNVLAQFPVGSTTVTYTATDASNNTATCSFIVKIIDTQAPVIVCPNNQVLSITAGCTSSTLIPSYLNGVQVTDNCPTNVQITQTPTPGALVSSVVPVVAGNTFTVTMKAKDSQANNLQSNTCTFVVTLADGQAPVPNEPFLPNIVSFCGKDTVNAPSATDCNGSTFVTIYGTPSVPVMGILPPLVPGGPPRYILNAGNYAITWSYTDPQNNTTTQLQSVIILVDNFPPTAICKSDSVSLDAAGNATIFATQLNNGSYDQDGCGPVTLKFKVGGNYVNSLTYTCANIGVNAVVFAATDVNNNTATCATTVKVKDVIAPAIQSVPANITVQACTTIAPQATLTATDVCDATVDIVKAETSTQGTSPRNCDYYTYAITRKWTATDDSGNKSTATQTVTVQDTQAPVFAANTPDSLVVITDPNRLTCDDTVTLNILDYVSDCAHDSVLAVSNSYNPSLKGNITGIYAVGTYIFTFTVSDPCGNFATKTVKVIVKDGTPPTAVCINGISVSLQPSGTVLIGTNQANNNSIDNCSGSNLNFKIQRLAPLGTAGNTVSFDCTDADAVTHHPIKLYVKDQVGNESNCQTYVVVQDNVKPTITFCPPAKTVQCTDDQSPAALGTALVTDNCPLTVSVSYADTLGNGSGNICKVLTRTWKAKDLAGNITICKQLISIQDTIKPVLSATPGNITIDCSENLAPPANITATDNCSQNVPVILQEDTINVAQGPCGKYNYTIKRTRTATDDCGNTTVHSRTITIVDNTPPEFLGMPDTLVINSADFPPNSNCTVALNLNVNQYLFDCEADSSILVTNDAPHGNHSTDLSGDYGVGTYSVHFSGIDACGNVGLDSLLLIVKDNSIPTAVCNNNVVISLGTAGTASIDPTDIDLGSNDNCGIDTMWLSKSTFSCADLGSNQIKLFVQDIHGNMNSCTVEVKVELGVNSGFALSATGSPEVYFGADDGKAKAVVSGGSGNFTYTWSNGLTTTTLSNLHAGTYTVTVADQSNGCMAIDTAIVDEGVKISLAAGAASGCQNDMVSIPVTIDNLFNCNGLSFSMNLSNNTVGAINGIANLNPLLSGLIANPLPGGSIGIFWANTGAPLTLPAGTVLFDLKITLGTAAVNTTSSVNFATTPLQLEFNIDSSGTDVILGINSVDINNGSVTINCSTPDLKVSGKFQTWKVPVKPIPGVTVNLTGGATATQVTPADGSYMFGIPNNTTVTVSGNKVTAGNEGITAADLLFITNHIFNNLLPSPYQWVAADANGDGNITLNDYLRIQRVALGTDQHILGSPDWKFIPQSYVFPSPNPLSAPYPQSVSACCTDTLINMVGVRIGDVNGNLTPSLSGNDVENRTVGTFHIRLDERAFQRNDMISIPFRAQDFNNRQAYQLTIDFDPSVFQLENIEPGKLPNMTQDNFGTTHLSDGNLTTLWVNRDPVSLADGDVLFTLTFRALRNGSALSEVLHAGSEVTRAEAYDLEGNIMKVDFDFVQPNNGQQIEPFALYQNQPNPFHTGTNIGFRLPESGKATLRVYNMSGQLVKSFIGNFEKGYNEVNFRQDELGEAGVYWYELETPTHSDRKKMILMN